MTTRGLMIAAPASGTGKTTVMLGLLRALTEDGLAVQPFKSGPDYIDPAFHRAACGRASFNLDSWAMDETLIDTIAAEAGDADFVLAEGSMGLYDGVAQAGAIGNGASADIARRMGWPVVLVVDVSGQAQSAAATSCFSEPTSKAGSSGTSTSARMRSSCPSTNSARRGPRRATSPGARCR